MDDIQMKIDLILAIILLVMVCWVYHLQVSIWELKKLLSVQGDK